MICDPLKHAWEIWQSWLTPQYRVQWTGNNAFHLVPHIADRSAFFRGREELIWEHTLLPFCQEMVLVQRLLSKRYMSYKPSPTSMAIHLTQSMPLSVAALSRPRAMLFLTRRWPFASKVTQSYLAQLEASHATKGQMPKYSLNEHFFACAKSWHYMPICAPSVLCKRS